MDGAILRFGDFELDRGAYELRRDGRTLQLERIPLELLFLLTERRGCLVTRQEIIEQIWGKDVFLDAESSINTAVRKLRRALNDDPKAPRFIVTIAAKGYRFVGGVDRPGRQAITSPHRSASFTSNVEMPDVMVGRERELTRLHEYYARAKAGIRQLVFVTGEAGIGKTTFVSAFLDSLAVDGMRVGLGQCIEQYGSSEPYMPVFEALARLAQESRGKRVTEVLRDFAPTWLAQIPSLLSDAERRQLPIDSHGLTQRRVLREMAQALEALAAEMPLILVLEDLHWSDFSTLALLSAIARRPESARLMILGTYRPVDMLASSHPLRAAKQELELHHYCEELRLGLLSKGDIAEYLAMRFDEDEAAKSPEYVASVIHERTEGNPLFMVNVVNHLLERGSLLEPGKIEAPRTIRRMIELNFERLDANDQHLLEAASVAGVEFSAAAVAAAVERPLNEVEAGCTYLSRQEKFLSASGIDQWPDGTVASSFRFRHALYRDVLYESLPAGHRGELHQRIAQRKERGYGERADEIAAELAHHYRHANDKNKALGYLQLAGEQATKRAAFKEATGLIESALKLLDELPSETARLRAEFALRNLESTIAFARYGGASPQRERAIKRLCLVGEHLGEKEHLLSLLSLCNFYFHRGEEIRGTELAHRCLSLAKATGDAGLLADACAMAVLLANLGGKFRDALSHYETFLRADGIARASASPTNRSRNGIPYEIWSGTALAPPLQLLGHVGEALKSNEQSLKRARESRHLLSVAFVLTVMADNLRCFRREPEVARAEAEEGIAIAEENGFVYWLHVGRFVHGWALADLGQLEQGIAEMERGLAGFRELGGWAFQQYATARLAYAYARTGRKEEGLAMLNDALEESERTGGQMANAEMLRLKGEMLLLHVGTATGEAERCFRVAVDVARAQEARWWELRASVSLARFLRDTGRRDEARAMLAEIYNWFTEGFDTADLKDAEVLLDELSA